MAETQDYHEGHEWWPQPDPHLYEAVLHAVLPAEEVAEILETESAEGDEGGWFGLDFAVTPITLGLIVLSLEFAQWYSTAFPSRANLVAEIRAVPEEEALARIRRGEWLGLG